MIIEFVSSAGRQESSGTASRRLLPSAGSLLHAKSTGSKVIRDPPPKSVKQLEREPFGSVMGKAH